MLYWLLSLSSSGWRSSASVCGCGQWHIHYNSSMSVASYPGLLTPASYPGLLSPVFVACSTNVGEGLVKLSHIQ